MGVISDAIIGGIAWEAFSKSAAFYYEKINDLTLRAYIAMQLKGLDGLKDADEKQIEETAEIIEATIVDTPTEIKKIEDKGDQERAFKEYLQKSEAIKTIYAQNYVDKRKVNKSIKVEGDLKGVGIAEDGSIINQTIS